MNTQYLSIDEAAKLLGVKRSTVYAWTHRREIPHYKVGKHLRFVPDELDSWIQSKRVEPVR